MGIAREVGHDLVTVQRGPRRGPIALNAAVAIAAPVIVLTLLGQPQAGLVATSGGFLAWYLPTRSRRERAMWLPFIGVALIAASALGVASGGVSTVAAVVALCVVTCVAAWVGFALRLGPPGALFFLLITGASSHLVAPRSTGGAGIDGWFVIAMTGVGMLIAYAVVLTPLLVPRVNREDRRAWADRQRISWGLEPESRMILGRIVVAAVIAALVSLPLDVHRAYWIDLTIVVILQNGVRVRLTFERAVLRILGTVLGLGVFAGFAALQLHGVVLGLVLGVLQGISEWVVTKNYGLALLTITPLALLFATQGGTIDVGSDVVTRLADTLIGAAIAVAVLFASWWLVLRWRRLARWTGLASVEERPAD
jgi:hypothetical protein